MHKSDHYKHGRNKLLFLCTAALLIKKNTKVSAPVRLVWTGKGEYFSWN